MPYYARKFVRFDRGYAIGEMIPDGVVAPGRAAELVDMGLIAERTAEAARTPQEGAREPGGVNTKPEPESGAGEAQAAKTAAKRAVKQKT